MAFEYLDHTADIAVRLRGKDLAELLGAATDALRDVMVGAPCGEERTSAAERVSIGIEAEDREALLVDYLNEIIYRFDVEHRLPCRLRVESIQESGGVRLAASLETETFDPRRHVLKTEVKAATFHGIEVRATPVGLEVDVVFDL